MMNSAVIAIVTLAALVIAHPGGLECGTDTTSRLTLGATVMGGPVTEGTDGVVDVHFKLGQAGEPSIVTVSVHKTVATKLFFAAKYERN
jgi:hypothetical protein